MKTIIGIVGQKGSGKETVANILTDYLLPIPVAHVRSSDILSETLKLWDLHHTRNNLQNLAILMDKGFGTGTVTHAVSARIDKITDEIVIFDGVRWPSDVSMIKSFPNNFIIYVTASERTRYERTKARKEKLNEDFTSFEEFQKDEQVATELDIPVIGEKADITMNNDSSLDDLKKQVSDFANSYLKKNNS